MGNIIKVAILPIVDKKLLVCRRQNFEMLIELGGRLEPGETDIECAEREVMEEAQCDVTNLFYYNTFEGLRGDEPQSKIVLRCYFGNLIGNPVLREGDSVVGFVWIDRNWKEEGHKLPPTMQKLVTRLIADGYL